MEDPEFQPRSLYLESYNNNNNRDFPGGPVVKILPSNVRGAGSIPGWGAKIPHTTRPKNQNIKQQQYWNKFNQDFKKWCTSKKSLKDNNNIIKYCYVLLSNNYYFIFLP